MVARLRDPVRGTAVLCALAVGLAASPVRAAPKTTPETMAGTRATVQMSARAEADGGDLGAAAERLDAAARQLGDPVLFLDAADAYYAVAEKERDPAVLDVAEERARIALDILYFLQGPMATDDWRPVGATEVPGLVQRANDFLARSAALRTELASTAADAEDEGDKGPRGGPKALVATGGVLVGLGVAGLGAGVAGLAIGAAQQKKATDPTVYGTAYDDVERKGKVANALAYAGFAVGAVLTGVGIALLVVGKKKAADRGEEQARIRILPALGGLTLTGRF